MFDFKKKIYWTNFWAAKINKNPLFEKQKFCNTLLNKFLASKNTFIKKVAS